jgi:hypothetical protein
VAAVSSTSNRPRWNRFLKFAFAVGTVVVSAEVLWARQTPEALLGADSRSDAIFTVLLFAAPGFALYLGLATSRVAIVIEGTAISALTIAQWWISATDWHSTASLGPGLLGWMLVPAIAVAGRFAPLLGAEWTHGPTRHRPSVLAPLAASGPLLFFPVLGWVVIVAIWVLWWRRLPSTPRRQRLPP